MPCRASWWRRFTARSSFAVSDCSWRSLEAVKVRCLDSSTLQNEGNPAEWEGWCEVLYGCEHNILDVVWCNKHHVIFSLQSSIIHAPSLLEVLNKSPHLRLLETSMMWIFGPHKRPPLFQNALPRWPNSYTAVCKESLQVEQKSLRFGHCVLRVPKCRPCDGHTLNISQYDSICNLLEILFLFWDPRLLEWSRDLTPHLETARCNSLVKHQLPNSTPSISLVRKPRNVPKLSQGL